MRHGQYEGVRRIICAFAAKPKPMLLMGGRVSSLKSDDPATCVKTVAELSDDKELFFVVMNIGVYIGARTGSYYTAFLTEENHVDDVRVAAVEQLSDDRQLARIALDPLTDCPFDTSLPKYDLISNRIDWWSRTEKTSAMRIRKLAVSRMADAAVLRTVRTSTDDVARKSLREDIAWMDPVSGIGAVFANAFEDAQQAEENASHAKLPRFAERGSLQLQWTKNAVKGEY